MEIKEMYKERKNIRKMISNEKWKVTDSKRKLDILFHTEMRLSVEITKQEIDLFNKQNKEKKEQ